MTMAQFSMLISAVAIILAACSMFPSCEEKSPKTIKSQDVRYNERKSSFDLFKPSLFVTTTWGDGVQTFRTYIPKINGYGKLDFDVYEELRSERDFSSNEVKITDRVLFDRGKEINRDTHNIYDPKTDKVTIPVTGTYHLNELKKNGVYLEFYLSAGDQIEHVKKLESAW